MVSTDPAVLIAVGALLFALRKEMRFASAEPEVFACRNCPNGQSARGKPAMNRGSIPQLVGRFRRPLRKKNFSSLSISSRLIRRHGRARA